MEWQSGCIHFSKNSGFVNCPLIFAVDHRAAERTLSPDVAGNVSTCSTWFLAKAKWVEPTAQNSHDFMPAAGFDQPTKVGHGTRNGALIANESRRWAMDRGRMTAFALEANAKTIYVLGKHAKQTRSGERGKTPPIFTWPTNCRLAQARTGLGVKGAQYLAMTRGRACVRSQQPGRSRHSSSMPLLQAASQLARGGNRHDKQGRCATGGKS